MFIDKRWLTAGVVLGGVIAVFGPWDWAVACFVFCLTAAWGQDKLDRQARVTAFQRRIESI